jgi:transcriptional regulator with XRE-family HTH domain
LTDETIAYRLIRLRTECRVSQRQLAEPGISNSYIARIESGTRTPSIKTIRQLAKKLGVTPEYLETGHESPYVDQIAELERQLEIALEDSVLRGVAYRYLFECGCLLDAREALEIPFCPVHKSPDSRIHGKYNYDCGCYFRTTGMGPAQCPIHDEPMGQWSIGGGHRLQDTDLIANKTS